jgi:hypothetical protein
MVRIEAKANQLRHGSSRQTLIEQELHALFGRSSTLSSTIDAA